MKQHITSALIACALVLASLTASAQNPIYAAQTLTVPTVTAGATSNSLAIVIGPLKQQNVALQWKVNSTTFAAGTNLAFNIGTSVDGLSFTTNTHSVLMTGNIIVTNIAVNGIGYLRIDSVTATGIAATNEVKYGIKLNCP